MTRLPLLCSLVLSLSLFPYYSNPQPAALSSEPVEESKGGGSTFKWDRYLREQVVAAYADSSRYPYRRAQVRAESADNPRATSDFKGWKKSGIDTARAIKRGMGAAGLCQFIWATATRYGAETVSTTAAGDTIIANDIYNPFWSLRSMCRYMRNIERLLTTRASPAARRRLLKDRQFLELCATSSYNCGEGRVLRLLKKHSKWQDIKPRLPLETQNYSEKIVKKAQF